MAVKSYDIIVVGSGGGSKITRPAAERGYRVAVCEEALWGGTCLNHGCIPSKMLIHPADVATQLQDAARMSLDIQGWHVRFGDLVRRVNSSIDTESASIPHLYEKYPNIDAYPHRARFVEPKVLEVGDQHITAPHIILATGAKPALPTIEGLENTPYWTYKEALRCERQPKRLIIIGGGYIACELGHFFGSLGTDVHFIVRSKLLRLLDKEISESFAQRFAARFPVHLGAIPKRVSHKEGTFRLDCTQTGGKDFSIEGDALLVVTGVQPNTESLNVGASNIELDERGYIRVNETLESSCQGVYAMGDVIGRHLFRHTANFEGEYLFQHLVEENLAPITYPPVPYAVFTHPQIAGVGAREQDLQGVDYIAAVNTYADSAMGMALRSPEGEYCKVLVDRQTRKLLGAHIIGHEAATMVHMLIAYMTMGARIDDILGTIFIHPALPEIVRNTIRKVRSQLES